jgi:hypothetical protein
MFRATGRATARGRSGEDTGNWRRGLISENLLSEALGSKTLNPLGANPRTLKNSCGAFKVRPLTSRTLLLGGVPIVQTTPRPPDSAVTSVTGRVTATGCHRARSASGDGGLEVSYSNAAENPRN